MTDLPVDKIKKLLALASPGAGATEAEAARAMEMASALMMKYNIEQSDLMERPDVVLALVKTEKDGEKWVSWLAAATGNIIAVKPVMDPSAGGVKFIGTKPNVDAAVLLFPWLVTQVESLYKRDLPKGLSKNDRANFRASFKQACSGRVYQRAAEIRQQMTTDDAVAKRTTGSTALTVRNSVQQQLDAIEDFMLNTGFKTRPGKATKLKIGYGTALGAKAGNEVQLNKQVSGTRLAITHKR